jgi:hypothetical protein
MSINPKKDERLSQIARQITGKARSTDILVPEVAIKGTGYLLCFYPSGRRFIKVNRGIKAYIINGKKNEYGRVLIYTMQGDVVEIEPRELINTGFD